jgi:hypothetical protein
MRFFQVFLLPFILLGVVADNTVASLPAATPAPGAAPDPYIQELNKLISAAIPYATSLLQQNLPESYGNCGDHSPPQPCSGNANLYYEHKKYEYKVFARWISGLKSVNVTSAPVARTMSPAPRGAMITVDGVFASLPTSIYIGECFTFDKCSILWDNTHGCCGSNKHFSVELQLECSANNSTNPLAGLVVAGVKLDKFEITEKIVGIKINVDDITNSVQKAVGSLLTGLGNTPVIPGPNNTKLTILQFLNTDSTTHSLFHDMCNATP